MRRMATRFIAWIVASRSAGAIPRTRSMSTSGVTPVSQPRFPDVPHDQSPVPRVIGNPDLDLLGKAAAAENPRIDPVDVVRRAYEKYTVLRLQRADFDERLLDHLHVMLPTAP